LISCGYEICCTIFTQQVRASSRSCVIRVVVCLVALGCLQLVVNLLQYATTLMSLCCGTCFLGDRLVWQEVKCLIPLLEFYWLLVTYFFMLLHEVVVLDLHVWTLRSIVCGSCFTIKQEVSGWMDSILVGCLSTTTPSSVGLCVWRCSSHAWCFTILVYRWRNARFTSSTVVFAGVRPAIVQPRTVSWSTG
jgi:hypothetical protein